MSRRSIRKWTYLLDRCSRVTEVECCPFQIIQRMSAIDPSRAAAVVTGHSRGIGEAIAERLLVHGVRVLGVSRHENAALAERHATLQQSTVDVADAAALERWLANGTLGTFFKDCEHRSS